jgi:N-methylhydantoinase B/oxoprolinase/acetone carboxylase alpha subunit
MPPPCDLGDAFAINDPYHGGTHLPDVTVITPVFASDDQSIEFYLGSRGHHADIGGMTPGSMPPDSTHLEQEGVLFTNWQLLDAGEMREAQTLKAADLRSAIPPAILRRTWQTCGHRLPQTPRELKSCTA